MALRHFFKGDGLAAQSENLLFDASNRLDIESRQLADVRCRGARATARSTKPQADLRIPAFAATIPVPQIADAVFCQRLAEERQSAI